MNHWTPRAYLDSGKMTRKLHPEYIVKGKYPPQILNANFHNS